MLSVIAHLVRGALAALNFDFVLVPAPAGRPAPRRSPEPVRAPATAPQTEALRVADPRSQVQERQQWRDELEAMRVQLEEERKLRAEAVEALETEKFRLQRSHERLERARERRDAARAELREVTEKNKKLFSAAHHHHQRQEEKLRRAHTQHVDDVRLLRELGESRDRYLAVVEALLGRAGVAAVEKADSDAAAVERVVALLEEADVAGRGEGAEIRP